MKGIARTITLALLVALFMTSCTLDTPSTSGSEEMEILMPVFANPISGTSRAVDVSDSDISTSVSKLYLYQAPALMGFMEDDEIADGSSTVMVYGVPVVLTVTQDGTDIVYNGTSSDLLFTIRLHADGTLDYRQAADPVIRDVGNGGTQDFEYISVTEGTGMKVDENGDVQGSFRSWFAMGILGGSGSGASAMYGEVRSKGGIHAMVNLTMKMGRFSSQNLPDLSDAFAYDLDEKLAGFTDVAIKHPYQIGWLKDSVFSSYEYNNNETEGDYSPTNEEKCTMLNKKIIEIFGDDSWQVDYIG